MDRLYLKANVMDEAGTGTAWIDFEEDFVIKTLYKYDSMRLI
jgi:hypothetical protein